MPRKSHKRTPTIISGTLYLANGEGFGLDTPEWRSFVATGETFYHNDNRYTCRRERRRNGFYWYAFKKIDGKLSKVYLGTDDKLTPAALRSTFAGA